MFSLGSNISVSSLVFKILGVSVSSWGGPSQVCVLGSSVSHWVMFLESVVSMSSVTS